MDDLNRIRDRIDEIDREILQLLKNRYENARLLGRIKSRRNLDYRDPEREKNILRSIELTTTSLGLDPKLVQPIFEQIFASSIQIQKPQPNRTAKGLQDTKILIVGGTGGMGRFFARLLALNGAEIKLAGREIGRTRVAAKEMEVESGTLLDAASSDIVIISAPMQETTRIASEIIPLMKPESLLVDFSSVKTGVTDMIAEKIPRKNEYVSLHPLFGPNTDHIHSQTLAIILSSPGPQWHKLAKALEREGAKFVSMSAAQHDKTMAYVQGLHHFALIAFGLELDGMGGEPRTMALRETEKRIASLLENWETIIGIQQLNPFMPPLRQEFLETVNRLIAGRASQFNATKRKLASNVQKWSRKL